MFRSGYIWLPLAVALVVMAAPWVSAQNLLVNPGFDDDVDGWELSSFVTLEWDSLDAGGSSASGSGKVSLTDSRPGIGSGISQKTTVSPGDTFEIEVSLRFAPDQDATVAGEIFVFFAQLTGGCSGDFVATIGYSDIAEVQASDSWQRLVLHDVIAPEGATCATFAFNIRNSDTDPPSSGFFDDAFVRLINGTVDPCAYDHRYVVPAGAHAPGSEGALFATDMTLLNVGDGSADAEIFLLERDRDNSDPRSIVLEIPFPRGTAELADIVLDRFGSSNLAAAFRICSSQPVVGMSRTYALVSGAIVETFGQGIPAYPESEALVAGEVGHLTFLYENQSFRTNIGMVNTTSRSITVMITLFDVVGSELGTVSYALPAWGYMQRNRIFRELTSGDITAGSARIEVSGGSVLVYASVLDNATNDPTFFLAER